MRKVIGLLTVLLLVPGLAWAQSVKDLRLGELAQRVRAQRTQQELANVPYYTNETLPRGGGISIVGGAGSRAASTSGGEEAEGGSEGATTTESGEPECNEQCWRQRFQEKRQQITLAQRELSILEQDYQLARRQYDRDPNRAMRDQYSNTTAGGRRLQQLLEQIRDKQQEIQRLQAELVQLENDLRRAGGEPGWARPQ
ncbi:MAG: hypothetical protein ACE5G6_04515 [Terriglobia bacterium]